MLRIPTSASLVTFTGNSHKESGLLSIKEAATPREYMVEQAVGGD